MIVLAALATMLPFSELLPLLPSLSYVSTWWVRYGTSSCSSSVSTGLELERPRFAHAYFRAINGPIPFTGNWYCRPTAGTHECGQCPCGDKVSAGTWADARARRAGCVAGLFWIFHTWLCFKELQQCVLAYVHAGDQVCGDHSLLQRQHQTTPATKFVELLAVLWVLQHMIPMGTVVHVGISIGLFISTIAVPVWVQRRDRA